MRALSMILLSVAACSSGPSLSPSPDPPALVGVKWRVVSVAGRVPQPGHDITFTLDAAGRGGGETGCNSYGGRFSVEEGRLVMHELQSTAAICADPVAGGLERAFLETFESRPFIGLVPGELRLRGEAGEVVLVPAAGP